MKKAKKRIEPTISTCNLSSLYFLQFFDGCGIYMALIIILTFLTQIYDTLSNKQQNQIEKQRKEINTHNHNKSYRQMQIEKLQSGRKLNYEDLL